MIYEYRGELFPQYLRDGNMTQHIQATALHYCRGRGVDVGCGPWPLQGAQGVELLQGGEAMALPGAGFDYVFSSHCLEHLPDPVSALRHWHDCLRPGGVLFLYLPHPDMTYWLPQNCRKHLHSWTPAAMAQVVRDVGFVNVLHSERDLAWSFAVVGWRDWLP